jgi:cell division protein FtsN
VIARLCFAGLIIVLTGWIYHLTYRQQQIIELSELHLRALGVELPPSPVQRFGASVWAAAQWVNDRLRPVPMPASPDVEPAEDVAELEQPATEPMPAVRPSPVPRDLPETVPMGRAWEESAAELPERDEQQVRQDEEYAAFLARLDEIAKGVKA